MEQTVVHNKSRSPLSNDTKYVKINTIFEKTKCPQSTMTKGGPNFTEKFGLFCWHDQHNINSLKIKFAYQKCVSTYSMKSTGSVEAGSNCNKVLGKFV